MRTEARSVKALACSDPGASAAVEPSRKPSSTLGEGGSVGGAAATADGGGIGRGVDGIAVTAAPSACLPTFRRRKGHIGQTVAACAGSSSESTTE